MKRLLSFVVVLLATFYEIRSASVVDIQVVGDAANCNGKPDGNYLHPTDCTRFISCSGQVATDGYCPPCDHNLQPNKCLPGGRLVFSDTKNTCLGADDTECKVSGGGGNMQPSMQQTNIQLLTDNTGMSTASEGAPCDPKLCKTEGYCMHYFRCDPNSNTWVKEMCGYGLLWNPFGADGNRQIHGGNCGDPTKLDKNTMDGYRNDPTCLECHWTEIGECSAKYRYQPPGLFYPNEQELECDAGLVFVKIKGTCLRCQDVKNSNGQACC